MSSRTTIRVNIWEYYKYKVQEKVKFNLLDIINIFDFFLASAKEVSTVISTGRAHEVLLGGAVAQLEITDFLATLFGLKKNCDKTRFMSNIIRIDVWWQTI